MEHYEKQLKELGLTDQQIAAVKIIMANYAIDASIDSHVLREAYTIYNKDDESE